MSNIMASSQVWGSTGTDGTATSGGTDRLASDKHTFLKLLVAQLTNQDPLDPTDDKEFVAQLAQFTSLEQLQEINAGVGTLNATMTQGQMMTATGFIGKDVFVSGNQVTKFSDDEGNIYTTKVYYSFEENVAAHQVTILDSGGNIMFYKDLGAHTAGTDQYLWDGRDVNGKEVPGGVYQIFISAQDANGRSVLSNQQFSARVIGVMQEDGVYKLALDGGRVVPITDVNTITEPTKTDAGGTTEPDPVPEPEPAPDPDPEPAITP